QVAGAVLGAIIGGGWGQVISQGTQFGLGTAFLRFSREYEKQADILGAQIMARAGYDPRDMANMFRTIEKESGSGGPQWLSDHPTADTRGAHLTREAGALRAPTPFRAPPASQGARAHLRQRRRAPRPEEAPRAGGGRAGGRGGPRGRAARVPTVPAEAPA